MDRNIWSSITNSESNKVEAHWIKKCYGKSNNTTAGNRLMTTHPTWKFYSLHIWIIHIKKGIRVLWIKIHVTNFQETLGLIPMTYQHWIKKLTVICKAIDILLQIEVFIPFRFLNLHNCIWFHSFRNPIKTTINFNIYYFPQRVFKFQGPEYDLI